MLLHSKGSDTLIHTYPHTDTNTLIYIIKKKTCKSLLGKETTLNTFVGKRGQWSAEREHRGSFKSFTLKAKMRMMPGMEAIRMSQRHPMVGMTTEAMPMMSREPASQKTWEERLET